MIEIREAQRDFIYVGAGGSYTVDGLEYQARITDAIGEVQDAIGGLGTAEITLTNGAGEYILLTEASGRVEVYIADTKYYTLGAAFFTALPIQSATTASSANVHCDGSGVIRRSTSRRSGKAEIEDYPAGAAASLRARTFKSLADGDDPDQVHLGLVAEEVHEAEPLLVTYDKHGDPDAVAYDRLAVVLLAEVQRLQARVAALES